LVANQKKPPLPKRRQPQRANHRPPAPPMAPPDQPTLRRRLALLGLHLPEVRPPAFQYVPVVVHGGLAYVSGQVPFHEGEVRPVGKVGREVELEAAKDAARLCTLQALSWLNQTLAGGLDDIDRVVKLTGFVASAPGFNDQPKVIDAASEVLVKLFGQAGQHARSAIGVAELPRDAAVEVEFIFALKRCNPPMTQQRRPGIKVVERKKDRS
jgi:enamine deaminase RidA (YjgF/YER057c/UK114 family)